MKKNIEGLDSGADVYISKPFNADYLKTVIRNHIKNKKNMEEYYHRRFRKSCIKSDSIIILTFTKNSQNNTSKLRKNTGKPTG
ncbi:hypothetical protein EZS27_026637 [termite gut metagenome]|uniref:Response regulatory domain-containing protein n=1 Tax=termite gut metagenome TaxID=433724 RepID=A0A5J4QSF5_9ZZZZ